jgi:hypothetical protein
MPASTSGRRLVAEVFFSQSVPPSAEGGLAGGAPVPVGCRTPRASCPSEKGAEGRDQGWQHPEEQEAAVDQRCERRSGGAPAGDRPRCSRISRYQVLRASYVDFETPRAARHEPSVSPPNPDPMMTTRWRVPAAGMLIDLLGYDFAWAARSPSLARTAG